MKFVGWSRSAAAALALAALAASAQAATVRLNGSTTVADRVVQPHQAEVQKATGHTIALVANGTGKGLVDLLAGRCDAAMSSDSLDIAVAAAKLAGAHPDPAKLQIHVVSHDEIVFVVNPANPVRRLSWQQLRDIHTGRVRNWSQVGGPNQPITVYAETPTGGTRAAIKATVMGGAEYLASIVSLPAQKKVPEMVGFDPTGIAGVAKGFVDARQAIVETAKVERPLGFITIGSPTPAVKAVIDAFRAAVAKD
jgi:phosphate transport system substrate-binding protein